MDEDSLKSTAWMMPSKMTEIEDVGVITGKGSFNKLLKFPRGGLTLSMN